MLAKLLNHNSLFYGILAGLLFPLAGYFFISSFFEILEGLGITNSKGMSVNFRLRTSSVVAICLNLLPMRAHSRQRNTQSMRGIVLVTAALGIIWFFAFKNEFLPS